MKRSAYTGILVLINSLLLLTLLGVVPFAWILRDGLGPNSVTSNGLDALARAFTTLYAGPALLCLCGLHFLVRHILHKQAGRGSKVGSSVLILASGLLFGGITLALIGLAFD
ncbi:MAG: hypothetical protein CMN04_03615 [Roseibacillus sp.]|nr:hypothetical protein [Roseibacillus sp.]